MELWLAGLLFIASLGSAASFMVIFRKNKKKRYIVIAALTVAFGLLLLLYMGLTLILLDGIK